MAVDRLSALPDDVLQRVLYFVPAKEGASTAVLSRRWRSLWHTSGAVNLESRLIVDRDLYKKDVRAMSKAFFRGAEVALAAAHAGGSVRRLTLHVESDSTNYTGWFLTRRRVCAMFSNPTTQHVEELRIGATVTCELMMFKSRLETAEFYKLSFGALPSEALRVLHIINCRNLKPPRSRVTFPRLARLHLQGCIISLDVMQRIIDAVPQLATLHLESFSFPQEGAKNEEFYGHRKIPPKNGSAVGLTCYQLRCLTVNTLVLENCKWPEVEGGLEFEVLKLQYFVYKGLVNCFNSTKVLKLKLDFVIDFLAFVDKKGHGELLNYNLFFHLEELELDGNYYEPGRETAAMALANFLHCCPVARHLRLKLKQWSTTFGFLTRTKEAQLDFDKSIDYFRRHKRWQALEEHHVGRLVQHPSSNLFHQLGLHCKRPLCKVAVHLTNNGGIAEQELGKLPLRQGSLIVNKVDLLRSLPQAADLLADRQDDYRITIVLEPVLVDDILLVTGFAFVLDGLRHKEQR
ncbi:hypothetical protein EJB05_26293, partial [Eragrostis curvula]